MMWSRDGVVKRSDVMMTNAAGPDVVHNGAVLGAAWSRDGARILSWSMDKTARVSEAISGKAIATFRGNTARAQFSPDETMVLVRGGGMAQLWSVAGDAHRGGVSGGVRGLPVGQSGDRRGHRRRLCLRPEACHGGGPDGPGEQGLCDATARTELLDLGEDGRTLTFGARYLDKVDALRQRRSCAGARARMSARGSRNGMTGCSTSCLAGSARGRLLVLVSDLGLGLGAE